VRADSTSNVRADSTFTVRADITSTVRADSTSTVRANSTATVVGLIGGGNPGPQEGGRDPGPPVGGQGPGQPVGEQDHPQQVGGTDQCAYNWVDQIITPASGGHRSRYAAEDNAPADIVDAAPIDVDDDHTHPDEGNFPKTSKEGDIHLKRRCLRRPFVGGRCLRR
jgi:hypothetical protein